MIHRVGQNQPTNPAPESQGPTRELVAGSESINATSLPIFNKLLPRQLKSTGPSLTNRAEIPAASSTRLAAKAARMILAKGAGPRILPGQQQRQP